MVYPQWTTYLAALLTPTVALFDVYIAYRQWRTAQNKLKSELFERRLLIYEAVRSYISVVLTTGKTSQEEEVRYLSGTRGTQWLFGNEIVYYIDKILWKKICDLSCVQSELEDLPNGEERIAKIKSKAEIRKWLVEQTKELDAKFGPYLSLRH